MAESLLATWLRPWSGDDLCSVCAERRVVVEGDGADRTVAIVCGSVVAFFAVLLVVLFPFRHNIKLAVKQRLRTPPSDEGRHS